MISRMTNIVHGLSHYYLAIIWRAWLSGHKIHLQKTIRNQTKSKRGYSIGQHVCILLTIRSSLQQTVPSRKYLETDYTTVKMRLVDVLNVYSTCFWNTIRFLYNYLPYMLITSIMWHFNFPLKENIVQDTLNKLFNYRLWWEVHHRV